MRLAYFSPLPPQPSGIADYSAELLPALARHLEVEPFVDEGVRVDPEIAARFTVRGDKAFPALWESGRYDAVLYHVGNNPEYHSRVWRMLLRVPGIVVLHEPMLHHLVRGMTLSRGDLDGYVEEMRYAYGRTGESLARRSLGTGIPLDVWSYPLFERVVDASLGLIVHNDCTRDRVLASRPGTRIAKVPHHLSLDAPGEVANASPEALRAALGLPAQGLLVASFGFITPAKRMDVALRAFARLRREVAPGALYLLVGEVSPQYDFAKLLTPELSAGVVPVGRTDLPAFLRYMAAADVTINLRYPSAGETSGTLIRLLGLGKAVVVSDTGAFAEIPDGCCAKIDLDATEEELLFVTLRALASDPELRRRMGENARRHIAAHHTLEGSAAGYADFVRAIVEARPEPFRAVPPLAPYPPADVLSDIAAAVAAEAVDLGGGEEGGDEDEILAELAAVMADLGLGR
ncbi:MAG TPA: glycosyltransferase family 4 protein [Thermoanaerobaculia bacterium]|jgi:glycosyltransferase involved in cell wall biosynthesis|nr:glycosyltransferase family 4 protein [Thermoanaerobaculia bacterium]